MDEFPTPDEEFELMYAEELELLKQQEDEPRSPKKSRKSLDFTQTSNETLRNTQQSIIDDDLVPLENIAIDTQGSSSVSQNTNKRSIQDLFGDIDDILNENERPKRHKSEDDYALIDHIIQLRRLAKEKEAPDLSRKDYTTAGINKNNISYSIPNYPFVGITRHDEQRVYIRCHSEQYEKEDRERIIQQISLTGNLNTRELWDEAQNLILKQTEIEEIVETPVSTDKNLWVDLYKPRKYFELLSDESTNRIMLKWLKLWDKVVFKRRPKPNLKKNDNKKNKFELCTDLDEHGRPFHKVALLCGPPGLGKTTLAHMVAKHCGYNVVEINASDDRSLDTFKNTLENATQMRSVLDSEGRPNCLVFDEIDGAPAASIDYLVKFVSGVAVKGKKKNKKENILKRPIICICNDVYVPALRPLRQIAFVVNFPQTSNTRLAERLMQIAKWQGINTDMGAMLALAQKSQSDIRSCLSFLHFIKSENKPVYLSDIHKSNVGQKDMQKGIFAVWNDIFFIERLKTEPRYETLKERMARILGVVNAFGDYEKVAQGVFENYVNMQYKSTNFEETCLGTEWFSFSDLLNKDIFGKQNYDLFTYLQYGFVVWHFAFGSKVWQKLQYPSMGYEVRTKRNRQKAIIMELMRSMQPQIRSYVQPVSLILDILPLLSMIIVPSFRPISLHLYTEEERKVLDHVVNVMIDYNLTYVQERTSDGSYVYKLDPSIDEIGSFGPKKTLSYSNKQLIAQEIENVKLKRFEHVGAASEKEKDSENAVPNHLQTLKAKKVASSSRSSVSAKCFNFIKKFLCVIVKTHNSNFSSSSV